MATIDESRRYERFLRSQEAERQRDHDERQQLWAFVWILFGFKMVAGAILLYWLEWQDFVYLFTAISWPWFVVPAIALAGPISNRMRLRRARRKRNALRRAEFHLHRTQEAGATESAMTLLDEDGKPLASRKPGGAGLD